MTANHHTVIPAKAGTHFDPAPACGTRGKAVPLHVIPAKAGIQAR